MARPQQQQQPWAAGPPQPGATPAGYPGFAAPPLQQQQQQASQQQPFPPQPQQQPPPQQPSQPASAGSSLPFLGWFQSGSQPQLQQAQQQQPTLPYPQQQPLPYPPPSQQQQQVGPQVPPKSMPTPPPQGLPGAAVPPLDLSKVPVAEWTALVQRVRSPSAADVVDACKELETVAAASGMALSHNGVVVLGAYSSRGIQAAFLHRAPL